MKTTPSKEKHPCQTIQAPRPQLTVRCDLHAGRNGDCAMGVGYWRKELNSLRQIADALNCS